MKPLKLTLAVAALLGVGMGAPQALDLYVDTKTKQLYAEPGKGRVRLGTFEQVDEAAADKKASKRSVQEMEHSLDKKKEELQALEARLDKKKDAMRAVEKKIDTAAAAAPASTEKKWYDKLNIGGYTQMRYSQMLSSRDETDHVGLQTPTDRSVGNNTDFLFRRVRLKISGDLSDWMSLYFQTDFASGISGVSSTDSTSTNNFAQIRDAYADIYFDKRREYRIRAGQSKVPFGWENLQSSQNRLSFERAEALNAYAVRDERDLGLFAYWSPETAQQRFKYLQKSGLKGSGDYGVAGFGIYNGAGANRFEINDNLYFVGRLTYPFELPGSQMLEVGASGYTGRYYNTPTTITLADKTTVTPTTPGAKMVGSNPADKGKPVQAGFQDQRGAIHAILYPRPFGLQTEWSWGQGPELSPDYKTIDIAGNSGGYVQAMYKVDHFYGTWIPYVKWQTYNGGSKFDKNSPHVSLQEWETGVEWQPIPEIELTAAYSNMNRTNVTQTSALTYGTPTPYARFNGDLLRLQLQWNY